MNTHCLDVTCSVCVELDSRNLQGGNFFRVNLSRDITLDHPDGKVAAQPGDQGGNQACFSRAGAPHHIDEAYAFFTQYGAHFGADVLVPFHHLMQYLNFHRLVDLQTFHCTFPSGQPLQADAAAGRALDMRA